SNTNTFAFCCCDNWISFSVALTGGSGMRAGTVPCGDCAVKRLKLGREKPLKFGKERRLKSGKEKRLKFGKALAVAAPMTANANRHTTIARTRLEAPCS